MGLLRCPTCSTGLARCHREGFVERVVLGPVAFVRPFRCPQCGFRGLKMTHQPDRRETLLFLALLAAGLLVVQLLWLVRSSAPEHPGVGYEPRDMERQRYLEERPER